MDSQMASADNSVVSLKSLLDAVRNNDVQRFKFLFSINPAILDLAAKNWPENPLIAVCKLRSFGVVEEIRIRKPEFARLKDDGDCCDLLHWSCVRGDAEMVKVLVGLDSQLCCVCLTELSMIPLQTAVIHGRLDVMRELLRARPESLEAVTSLNETVFHLAAKFHQPEALMFLLKEVKPNQGHLLYVVDCEGFSVPTIATENPFTDETVGHEQHDSESEDNGQQQPNFFDVFVKNHPVQEYETVGHEQLDSESEDNGQLIISDDSVSNHPVLEVITFDELQRLQNGIRGCNSRRWLLKKRKFMLIFPAILLGLGFCSTVILPYFFPREKSIPDNQVVFQFRDIVTRHLPPVFYIMTLITIVLTTSSIKLTMLLFSLPFGGLLFLCGISTFALYVLLSYCIMPRFFVRIGSHDVSSFQVMWALALGLVFLVAVIFLLVKYCFHKPILRMKNLLTLVLSDLCFRFTAALSFLCFRLKVVLSYLWLRLKQHIQRRISYNIIMSHATIQLQ
ncbi:hypothetical protein Ddye_013258 [Dipteronia dyeriana]|uniref:Ankyrin repeat-containing protein n=1 Tax=Dipteronia dyeriana TaxID=168575 RepID=A0AAD9X640_9ROSI|nr:hypothetical protein Ddye_013258 [Dipteronia dyeriana]